MFQPLWQADELKSAIQGEWFHIVKGCSATHPGMDVCSGTIQPITGISIDTRTLRSGDVFFAIRGEHADGHDYIQQAWNKGASVVVTDKRYEGVVGGPTLRVSSTFDALGMLGSAARKRAKRAKIIGITGSVGKTTAKNMTYRLLARFGHTVASMGNQNNHYGVPLNLARMPENTDFGIFEMGISAPGEMTELSMAVLPHIALITGIAAAHEEFFTSKHEIAVEKSNIMDGLQQDGVLVYPHDSPYRSVFTVKAAALNRGIRSVGFGKHSGSDVRLIQRLPMPSQGGRFSELNIQVHGHYLQYRLSLPGLAMAKLSLGILAMLDVLNIDLHKALPYFSTLSPFEGRGSWHHIRKKRGMVTLIDDAYNANPTSMRESLRLFLAQRNGFPGKSMVILGDMLELDDKAEMYHKSLASLLKNNKIDHIILCGNHMRHLYDVLKDREGVVHYHDPDAVFEDIKDKLDIGDIVLIKGSHGSGMHKVVKNLIQ